jgi:NitT/TauT family transport system ATP-binding protein
MSGTLIEVHSCSKSFPTAEGKGSFLALQDVSVAVERGEVVALLGRSGSGKSTLLRIMAGLIPYTSGAVTSDGKPLTGPNPDVAMVFQSFALLPWLTVIENVEIGLEARGVARLARTRLALKAIDLVGLDGFESAYPRELSGGMKQRVGFARAMVVEPKVLFLDEPFSALDVLTAENLRGEIDELWNAKTFPAQSIVLVTHNIEEAVFLADRVLVLSTSPGRVRGEVHIDLQRPHDRNDPHFKELTDYLYHVMTNPEQEIAAQAPATVSASNVAPRAAAGAPQARPLPHVRVATISGMLELIEDMGSNQDVAEIAARLAVSVDDFLAILDAAVLLGFATVEAGIVALTSEGRVFATASIQESKEIFRTHVLAHVPFLATVVNTLAAKENKSMRADFFLDLLEEHYSANEAQRQFETAVDWGRYAELFEYDAGSQRLWLSHPPAIDDDSSRDGASIESRT